MSHEWTRSAWPEGGYATNPPTTRTWFDEVARWALNPETAPNALHKSEVRITFSRGFTWSEREAFRQFIDRIRCDHYWINPSVVYIYADLESRKLVEKVSEFVANEYLNIHPRAVRTFYPEVIV